MRSPARTAIGDHAAPSLDMRFGHAHPPFASRRRRSRGRSDERVARPANGDRDLPLPDGQKARRAEAGLPAVRGGERRHQDRRYLQAGSDHHVGCAGRAGRAPTGGYCNHRRPQRLLHVAQHRRSADQSGRRQGRVPRQLSSAISRCRPPRRPGLRDALRVRHADALLQQGRLPQSRPRSRSAAEDVGRGHQPPPRPSRTRPASPASPISPPATRTTGRC